jgi:protein-tyrosine-phosphatase
MKVLFVCTQNIFRSFSAEKLLKLYLQKKKNTNIIVSSAGTLAYPDEPYSYTLEELQKLGVRDLEHRQQRLSQGLVDEQDIIICMTKNHQMAVYDQFGRKSFLFQELASGKKIDLEDDVETETSGGSLEPFVISVVQKIYEGIPKIYEKICKGQKL